MDMESWGHHKILFNKIVFRLNTIFKIGLSMLCEAVVPNRRPRRGGTMRKADRLPDGRVIRAQKKAAGFSPDGCGIYSTVRSQAVA
jgi:hypothetical protein